MAGKDCPTQTLGLFFAPNGGCTTASSLNQISAQQVPTQWIHSFIPTSLNTKCPLYDNQKQWIEKQFISVTNKNKTLAHLYHVLLLKNYLHCTLTQNLPEESGGACLFLSMLQKGDLKSRVTCLGPCGMLATVRRIYMGPLTLNQSCC